MAGKEQVMALLMGPVEVRQAFRDWPAGMCLAVCLMESGDCQLVVFRHEETAEFPARLRRHLGLSAAELCFFPQVDGYPTRALLYSDECRLMALVAEAPEIVEEAADYSVNYAYALDEGLDPAVFLGVESGRGGPEPELEAEVEAIAVADRPVDERDASFVSRRSRPAAAPAPMVAGRVRKALLPGFMQRQDAERPGPHFRSARELGVSEDHPVLCDVLAEKSGWILIAQHGEGGADIRVSDPDLIYLRDDRSVVAIRLEPPWQTSAALPGRIWIRADSLPQSLRAVFADCVGTAELTSTGSFLYLHVRRRSVQPLMQAPAEMPSPFAVAQTLRAAPPVAEAEQDTAQAPEVAAQPDPDLASEVKVAAPAVPQAIAPSPVSPPVPARRGGLWRGRRRWLAVTAAASVLVLIQIGLQLGGRGEVDANGADRPIDWEIFRSAWQAAKAG
ncbi:MAG: hypothetical protein AB7S99_04790 [Pseudodonghicola sp.]